MPVPTTDPIAFVPPQWIRDAVPDHKIPKMKIPMARVPTPIQRWHLPQIPPDGPEVYIKRDDLSGLELSGNKIRKLEFLLADAKEKGHDCVVTLGGIQSNHARATAVAARLLHMDAHLILRTSRLAVDDDPGLDGNLLVERMVGAKIHLVTKEEYSRFGQKNLGEELVAKLQGQGFNPYLIPVGGSSSLGTWGYLGEIDEIIQQVEDDDDLDITDIVSACGSGGTTAGLALGCCLAHRPWRVHAYLVCDSPAYFKEYIEILYDELEVNKDMLPETGVEGMVRFEQAKGQGYALSTREELDTVVQVARSTGIILDPVYTGKAVHAMLKDFREHPDVWKGKRVLFIHTGGIFGVYGSSHDILPVLKEASGDEGVCRMHVQLQEK